MKVIILYKTSLNTSKPLRWVLISYVGSDYCSNRSAFGNFLVLGKHHFRVTYERLLRVYSKFVKFVFSTH
jgi:hypothetical protein